MEDAKIQLTYKIDKVLNYAVIYNGFPIIHDICIKNTSDIEDTQKIKDIPVQEPKITKHFAEQDHVIKSNMNLTKPNQDVESLYHKESYISADLIMTDISTDEYVQSKNKKMITEKI